MHKCRSVECFRVGPCCFITTLIHNSIIFMYVVHIWTFLCSLRQRLCCKCCRTWKVLFMMRKGKNEETGPYLVVKRLVVRWLDREMEGRELLWEAWGDVWGHRGSSWFVSLSITHTLISFVVFKLNAPQQPVAVPLCITVWELCCVGGSPHSAPGRPRGLQLVYYGSRRGIDSGWSVCVCVSA